MILRKSQAIFVLELRPLLEMRFEHSNVSTIRESNEVASLKVGKLGRSANILGIQ